MDRQSLKAYLSLFESCISLSSHFIAIALFSRLLYYAIFKRKVMSVGQLSHSMLAFMLSHVLLSCTSFWYLLYVIINWTPNFVISYNKQILYWLGLVDSNHIYITPIPVLFLTLDRCFSLAYPNNYGTKQRKIMLLFTFMLFVFVYFIFTLVNLMEFPLDVSSEFLSSNWGQFVEMFCMIDAACCSILYSSILLKRKGSIKVGSNNQFPHSAIIKQKN
uniref:Vomeronasal type-1 receptor n=1 Tax=Ditylenchus dipsaci TaxID=166011 RepID=A0A915CY37_9BILA